ncbi:M48 family metallopeptidase [Burkholderiaceae bacterium DAT-1]|nr:M48 family metallopeptidase [Burkholderiaceae bacterium DAT-1]
MASSFGGTLAASVWHDSMMNDSDYEMLVWTLEAEAREQPGQFRLKVILFSLTAYLVLFGLLAGLCLVGVWLYGWVTESHSVRGMLILAGFAITVIPVLYATGKMLMMRLDVPTGREITAAEAPKLFRWLEGLRKQENGPPIYRVLITREYSAYISQVPRFGLFGGYRNYMVLGLPFLQTMSPREMMSIIAHEYGHLSGSHGKLSRWIYRQRITFGAVQAHASAHREEDMVNGLLASLLDRFGPYYNAYTFVLSRTNEYEADAASARTAGAEASASALIRCVLLGEWMSETFWPKLYDQVKQRSTPAFMPFSTLRKIASATQMEWATKEKLRAAWKVDSGVFDTHPCLRERVTALDQTAALPPDVKVSAADAMLGEFAHMLAREFDEAWWAEQKKNWQDYHRRYSRGQARIAELSALQLDSLSAGEAQEYALLLSEFRSHAEAKPVLKHLLDRSGERYPKPVFYYGRVLLSENNEVGLDYLHEAMQLSPSLTNDCAHAGYDWLMRNRGEEAAERWLVRIGVVTA